MTDDDRCVLPAFVYICLRNALKRSIEAVAKNSGSHDLAYCAWLARNVLELRVWVEYCIVSPEHAQEFHDDATRDLVDLNRKQNDLTPDQNASLSHAISCLPSSARQPHKYKDIKDAARDAGILEEFSIQYKSLSKLAHPTALMVIAPIVCEELIEVFLRTSREMAEAAIVTLDSSLLAKTFHKYQASIDAENAKRPPDLRIALE